MTDLQIAPAAHCPLTADLSRHITSLVHMTGPESYDYIFGTDGILDPFLKEAWVRDGNLYSRDAATVAWDREGLAGIEMGYAGHEFYQRRAALDAVSIALLQSGTTSRDTLSAIVARAERASYLNAHVPEDVYYLMVLAVPTARRGRGAGKRLLSNAIGNARKQGFRALHLDVLSNNPAIGLYRAMGLDCAAEIIAPSPCREHGVPMEMRMTIDL